MIRFGIASLAKFLTGILLVEALTALLVVAALKGTPATWPIAVAAALLGGTLAAMWFVSLANHASRAALAKAGEKYGRRQENALRRAEKEKEKEIRAAEKRAVRELKRARQQTSVRLGAALAGVSTVAVALLFTQFMTLGLLAVAASGGALLGYRLRARQEMPGSAAIGEPEPLQQLPEPEETHPPARRTG